MCDVGTVDSIVDADQASWESHDAHALPDLVADASESCQRFAPLHLLGQSSRLEHFIDDPAKGVVAYQALAGSRVYQKTDSSNAANRVEDLVVLQEDGMSIMSWRPSMEYNRGVDDKELFTIAFLFSLMFFLHSLSDLSKRWSR